MAGPLALVDAGGVWPNDLFPGGGSLLTSTFEARQHLRTEVERIGNRLIAEYAHVLPAGTVARHVRLAREELSGMGVQAGLPVALEAMVRRRLRDLQRAYV